jgi:hypothetical protein
MIHKAVYLHAAINTDSQKMRQRLDKVWKEMTGDGLPSIEKE